MARTHFPMSSSSLSLLDESISLPPKTTRPPLLGDRKPSHLMVPIEVFEAVIDQASNNAASLRRLSLTHPAFLARTRYHLFRGIVLRTEEQMRSTPEFLDSRPWLSLLVQRVTLSTSIPSDNTTPNLRLLDAVPVHLLTRLPKVRAWRMEQIWTFTASGQAWLSLHRSALSYYRRYGGHIRDLEVSNVPFDTLSDFIGLVSEITGIQNLTCSNIQFRTAKGPKLSFYGSGPETTMLFKPLKIRNLHVSAVFVEVAAVEYLLASSTATLENLRLAVLTSDQWRRSHVPEFLSRLSQLSSLTVVIPCHLSLLAEDPDAARGLSEYIHCSTRILERVSKAQMRDVCVEFEPDPVAGLGTHLAWGGAPLDACRGLEGALLAFPLQHIVLHNSVAKGRVGRAEFWSPIIKRAFPRLDERGLLKLPYTEPNTSDPVGHEDAVTCLVVSRDSKWTVTAARDGTIILWDTERGTVVQEWLAHRGPISDLAFSPDSCRIVSAGGVGDESLAVWDVRDRVYKVASPEGHTQDVTTCAWSPDGILIASGSEDGTVRTWDALAFQQRDLFHDPQDVTQPRHLKFSPNAQYLAWISQSSASGSCCAVVHSLRLMEEHPRILPSHPSRTHISINTLSFDPESTRIATAHGGWGGQAEDYVVRIWDVVTGANLALLTGHPRLVTDVSFSPNGKSVLSTSFQSAKVWDAESWINVDSFQEDGEEIQQSCFSPDGGYVATASWGKTVRLWRTSDGLCAKVFAEHKTSVWFVAFSPNGNFLVSGDDDGIVHIRAVPRLH